MSTKLSTLCIAKAGSGETAEDKDSAVSQIAEEQTVMGGSRKLLEDLLFGLQATAANVRKEQPQVINTFGDLHQGMQFGVNHGAISGITFGKTD